ncbi:LON peptidase substrate-binding domain-containing protein [Thalassotalea mangrovi]|nr:LON peptidase substrate-binding domain-containing protein [Thalassotalea mangrovi]
MNLAIFPLPVYLLPGGITRLRIFEQRYLKMVKEAASGDGFVISLHREGNEFNISDWGSWVHIIDFQHGDDGLLYIDVQCQDLVRIGTVERDQDKLLHGDVQVCEHWPVQQANDDTQLLGEELNKFFDANPTYASLYPDPDFGSPVWVCGRWLELIPINYEKKRCFIHPDSFSKAINFLSTVIIEKT